MGVHWKTRFLGGLIKKQYTGNCLKKGALTVCWFNWEGAWWKRGGSGGLIPQCTL